MKQNRIYEIPKKEIHLDLYVDESENREYKNGSTKEKIDYIMILAVPLDKKEELYGKLNNSRCLGDEEKVFGSCELECEYHSENNGEIHYREIKKENIKYKISNKWLDILLNNNFNKEESIYFNILGIIESNLDIELFGEEKQYGNIYTRFFRTALLRLIAVFNNYDKIVIEHIYHDCTTKMESHKYFNKSAINQIRMEQLINDEEKIIFKTNEVKFINSDHRIGDKVESQFIQFVDLILGVTCNVIHNDAVNNKAKIKLTEKIYPLIKRILDEKQYLNKNSRYNYFNKQIIGFFPSVSKDELKNKCKEIYGREVNIEDILKEGNFFKNTKPILFKVDDGQLTLF